MLSNKIAQWIRELTTNLQVIISNPARALIIFTEPTDFNKIFWLNIIKLEKSNNSSHAYLVLYHITSNFHHTWNNQKELFPAHSTTETRETILTKTDSMKKTTILITTQQITEKNNAIGIYNMKNYLYLERYAWFWATCIADRIFQFLFGFFFKTTSLTNTWHLLSLYCNPIEIISWLVQNIYLI